MLGYKESLRLMKQSVYETLTKEINEFNMSCKPVTNMHFDTTNELYSNIFQPLCGDECKNCKVRRKEIKYYEEQIKMIHYCKKIIKALNKVDEEKWSTEEIYIILLRIPKFNRKYIFRILSFNTHSFHLYYKTATPPLYNLGYKVNMLNKQGEDEFENILNRLETNGHKTERVNNLIKSLKFEYYHNKL